LPAAPDNEMANFYFFTGFGFFVDEEGRVVKKPQVRDVLIMIII